MSQFRRVVTPRVAEGDTVREAADGASKTGFIYAVG